MISRRTLVLRTTLFSLLAALSWQFWGRRPMGPVVSGTSTALPPPQFRTLVAACVASLDDEDAGLRAATGIDRFLQGEGREQLAELSLALKVLEHVPEGVFEPVRFSRLRRPERQAVLEQWVRSELATRRQIAMALHHAARFAHWSRADTWAEIGYDGPWVGRSGAP